MMAMTTSNSISVKPRLRRRVLSLDMEQTSCDDNYKIRKYDTLNWRRCRGPKSSGGRALAARTAQSGGLQPLAIPQVDSGPTF